MFSSYFFIIIIFISSLFFFICCCCFIHFYKETFRNGVRWCLKIKSILIYKHTYTHICINNKYSSKLQLNFNGKSFRFSVLFFFLFCFFYPDTEPLKEISWKIQCKRKTNILVLMQTEVWYRSISFIYNWI